jgi:hypothetical protein
LGLKLLVIDSKVKGSDEDVMGFEPSIEFYKSPTFRTPTASNYKKALLMVQDKRYVHKGFVLMVRRDKKRAFIVTFVACHQKTS